MHGVIAARIDLLGADERRVLRECAVVGRRFWPGAVGADPAVLASLARRELVSQRGHSTVESEHEYTFKHALTREVAYAALPRAERRRLHVQVAEWIEQMSSDRGLEVADLVAHHYAEAVDSGEDDPAVRARALDALIAAGSAAVRRSAGEPARANLRRALDLATDDHDRGRVELELGQADLWLNEVDEAIALLESARRRFEGLGDGPLLADVLAQLSRGYWYRARQSDALEAATGAVRVLEGLDETPALARALARRSQIEMLAALPEAVPHAAEAIDVARRIGDRYSEANAMINLASAEMFRGDTASEVIQRFIQAARIAVECGADEEAIRARVNYLWTAAPLIPISELLEGLERSMVVRDSMMLISGYHLYFDLSYHLFVHMPSGRWDEIDVDGGRDAAARQSTTLMLWLQLRASLALARGQVERAEPLIEEALMWSDRTSRAAANHADPVPGREAGRRSGPCGGGASPPRRCAREPAGPAVRWVRLGARAHGAASDEVDRSGRRAGGAVERDAPRACSRRVVGAPARGRRRALPGRGRVPPWPHATRPSARCGGWSSWNSAGKRRTTRPARGSISPMRSRPPARRTLPWWSGRRPGRCCDRWGW